MTKINNRKLWKLLFKPEHSESVRAELTRRAKDGDPEAQWFLASWMTYSKGEGYRPASRQAARLFLSAAELGFVPAMLETAQYLERRHGAQTEPAERWYRKAAQKGSAEAAWALGINAERGFANDADLMGAYRWFRQAAEHVAVNGWKPGEYALAGIVRGAKAVEGLRLLRKAAQAKSPEAQFYMGLRSLLGVGEKVNAEAARECFTRSAANRMATTSELGERCAHALLGRQLAFEPKTARLGIRHLERAAGAGLPLAHLDLALALLSRTKRWAPSARILREGVRLYQGTWRQPGSVWLGIERLTRLRMVLACGLLGIQRPSDDNHLRRLTLGFKGAGEALEF